jgi:sialate O-acetylesterase
MRPRLFFFLVLICSNTIVNAQTNVASFFSDGMILQQQKSINIWGIDSAGTKIHVVSSWGKTSQTTTSTNGKWKLQLTTPNAGGPHTITIKGSSTVTIDDVLIGEVWVCSGQSNMQLPLKGGLDGNFIEGGLDAIVNSRNDRIRFFTVRKNTSLKPLDNLKGKWKKANPSTSGSFSAVGYFFAQQLERVLDVPIGIVVTAWGASSAEAWTDSSTLKDLGLESPEKMAKMKQQTPSVLYNAMIHPLIGYGMKGILWYQGEANRHNAAQYEHIINAMVTSWREQWNIGDFPFYYAQIAPFNYGKSNSAFLREAQLKSSQSLQNAEMVVTLDVGDCTQIHPSKKREVGKRLSYIALAKDYGISGYDFKSPTLTNYFIEEQEIILTFSNRVHLNKNVDTSENFEIAGTDMVFYPANAVMTSPYHKDQKIRVFSEKVPHPKAVRYGFKNCVIPTLFGRNGLPVSSFRTDNLNANE